MTAARNRNLSIFYRALAGGLLTVLVTSCALPPESMYRYASARRLADANGTLDAMSIRRAESIDHRPLFNGASSMNVPTRASSINDIARLFAGMDGSGLSHVRNSATWVAHQQRMNSLWATHLSLHRDPLMQWASAEIGDVQNARSLFYPFSGPDFLFASAICPSAETYVMCGLEPAEPLPALSGLSQAEMESGLNGLHNSVSTIMTSSYFITTEMRSNLQATRFRGVLPIIMAFMARTGYTVDSVDTVRLDGAGNITLSGSSGNTGLMIRCRSGMGASKRVFYFRQDLSNGGVRANSPFFAFVSRLGATPTFLKSASYLMHEDSFSNIRNYILSHSSAIVQDPSGVPYRDIGRNGLNLWLYGNYRSTLTVFSGCQQPDLADAYASRRYPVKPLNFGIGYLMNPATTSLMVARPGR